MFIRLNDEEKNKSIQVITNNFKKLIINIISFKAIITLFEVPLPKESVYLITYILKDLHLSYYLEHSRYLKLLESILSNLNDNESDFVYFIVIKLCDKIIKQKQGFFLLRKILKSCINKVLLSNLIYTIIFNISVFFACNNGCNILYIILKVCFNDYNKRLQFTSTHYINISYQNTP